MSKIFENWQSLKKKTQCALLHLSFLQVLPSNIRIEPYLRAISVHLLSDKTAAVSPSLWDQGFCYQSDNIFSFGKFSKCLTLKLTLFNTNRSFYNFNFFIIIRKNLAKEIQLSSTYWIKLSVYYNFKSTKRSVLGVVLIKDLTQQYGPIGRRYISLCYEMHFLLASNCNLMSIGNITFWCNHIFIFLCFFTLETE